MKKEVQYKKYLDKSVPLKERQKDYAEKIDKMMNPLSNDKFKPEEFEPSGEGMRKVANRKRISPSKQLPTFGLKPKEIREGQMIGMYESKQDLYLMIAHRCNDLQNQVDALTTLVKTLQKK